MQPSVLASTFLGLVASSIAAAVGPDGASTTLSKKDDGILVTLCNDFHGGKPCETHDVWPGQCSKLHAGGPLPVPKTKAGEADYEADSKKKKKNRQRGLGLVQIRLVGQDRREQRVLHVLQVSLRAGQVFCASAPS